MNQPQAPKITLPPLPLPAVEMILHALGQLPLMQSRGLFDLIAGEAQKQVDAAAAPAAAPAATPAAAPAAAAAD